MRSLDAAPEIQRFRHVKRVLFLAYYFPPLGGAGVQRTVKFVKHLRELGYEAIVVTGPEDGGTHWTPTDRALAAEVPAELRVLRALGPQPAPDQSRARRWARIRSPFESWWQREATALGQSAIEDVDLVYASMSPFATARVARVLARESRKPWIADLRDPWALDEWTVYPTALHRAVEKRRMRAALRDATTVVMNTEEAALALVDEFPEFERSRVVTIPNGWDRGDFDQGTPPRTDGKFRIVYTGYSHVVAGRRHRDRGSLRSLLGGATRGLNVLARSHVFLAEALRLLTHVDRELAERVELHVAGPAPRDADEPAATGPSLRQHGYLPHDQAVALMRSADLLFLPMHDLPSGKRARTVPGKMYEYLASGRPILAALPDGDARDLLTGMPNVWLCRPTDIGAMAEALCEIGRLRSPPLPPREIVERFERRALAQRLAEVMDSVVSLTTSR